MTESPISVFERVRAALDRAGITYTHTHHAPVYTSAEAAAVRGVSLHSGAKALILKGEELVQFAIDLEVDIEREMNRLDLDGLNSNRVLAAGEDARQRG